METFLLIILGCYALGLLSLTWNVARTRSLVDHQRAAPIAKVADIDGPWPSLDLVIPVKDEEANIGACIKSVLAQDYPNLRITVVNDRSRDGTARVVEEIQKRHPNVRRVDIKALPDNMYGKPHAIHTLRKDLTADVLAFVDSDLILHDGCLRTLVHHLTEEHCDWIALMGAPEISTFWERTIVPLFGAVAFAWYDPRKISDPNWDDAIGSAFMLCTRDAYEAIDGHNAVIRTYDEDSELIRIAKRAKQKVSFLLTPELYTQRHYGTFARTVHGVTRTFVGGIKTIPRLLLTINALSFVSLFPFGVLALFGSYALMDRPLPYTPYWLGLAGYHLVLAFMLSRIIYRTANADRRFAWLHPLGSAILIGITIRAMLHLSRNEKISWRGTSYAS